MTPPVKNDGPVVASLIGCAGMCLGAVVSLVIYACAVVIGSRFTQGSQDPIQIMILLFGWIPSLVIGASVGVTFIIKCSARRRSED